MYLWVSYDQLSADQKAALPINVQVQVADFNQKLSAGVWSVPGCYPSIVVLHQNLSNHHDMLCSLHQNHKSSNMYDGLSNPHDLMIITLGSS